MNHNLSYQSIVPSNLSEIDLSKVFELEQDMWARNEGLGEYLSCDTCNITYSKQDLYDKKDRELYVKTVSEIEAINKHILPCCNHCGGELLHIFPREEYIEEMKKRYTTKAHMVIMMSEGKLVGFMDGHISDYDTIFDRDFSYRYSQKNKEEIAIAVKEILGEIPGLMFSCSSMGTRENFMFFHNIYSILQAFFSTFPKEYQDHTGISELDVGGSLEKVYSILGARKIDMSTISDLTKTKSYNSGIFIQKQLGRTYGEGFSNDLKTLLRNRST